MSEIRVDAIKTRAGAVPKAGDVGLNVTGTILQVKQATDENQRTITSTSYATASNTLTVNITPAATSSKMLVSFATESYFATNKQLCTLAN